MGKAGKRSRGGDSQDWFQFLVIEQRLGDYWSMTTTAAPSTTAPMPKAEPD